MNSLENLGRTQIERLVDEWIVGYANCERDRAILKRRLLDGVLFEPLAEEFDLSVRAVQAIVYRGVEKISRKNLDNSTK